MVKLEHGFMNIVCYKSVNKNVDTFWVTSLIHNVWFNNILYIYFNDKFNTQWFNIVYY